MKYIVIFLTFLVGIVSLSGCGTTFKQPSVEELGMVGVIGYDAAKGRQVDITTAIPIPLPGGTEITRVYDAKGTVTHEALTNISQQTDKTINLGQLRVVLFSKRMAKRGIIDYARDLYRNPQVGDMVLIGILDGDVDQTLTRHQSDQEPIQKFLYDFLAPREDIAFSPFTTMQSLIYHDTDLVSDPMIPVIQTEQGNKFIITGVALFKNGKLVHVIQSEDAKLLQGLTYRNKLPALKLKLNKSGTEQQTAMLSFVRSKISIKSNHNLENPVFNISFNLSGILDDYNGDLKLTNDQDLSKLEQEVNQQMEKETYQLLQCFKKYKVDPIGLGNKIRMYYPGQWSKERWDDSLAHATFHVKIKTNIISTGAVQ